MPEDDRDDDVGDASESEWEYSVSDLEETSAEDHDDRDGGEGVFGTFSPDEAIEPQPIDLENVLFVLLGAGVAIVGLFLMLP